MKSICVTNVKARWEVKDEKSRGAETRVRVLTNSDVTAASTTTGKQSHVSSALYRPLRRLSSTRATQTRGASTRGRLARDAQSPCAASLAFTARFKLSVTVST
eukprot:1932970-Pleurochrysis_carterae.AAC.2